MTPCPRTTTTGVTERMTILLDTKITINKNAAWLNDEALRSGVFFSLSSMEHHANSLALNSMLLSPGTNNLIAMKKRRVDRTGYSEDVETWGLDKKVRCRARQDLKDRNERYIYNTKIYKDLFSLTPLIAAAPSPSSPTVSLSASVS